MSNAALRQIQLKVLREGEREREIPLALASEDGVVLIGRADDCAVRLEDRAVSRRHAELRLIEGGARLQVRRKSEFAPIQLNGEEKSEGTLSPGDVLSVGPYRIRLVAGAGGDGEEGANDLVASSGPASSNLVVPSLASSAIEPAASSTSAAGEVFQPALQMQSLDSDPPGVETGTVEAAPVESVAEQPVEQEQGLELEFGGEAVESVQFDGGMPAGSDATRVGGISLGGPEGEDAAGRTRVGSLSSVEFVLRLSPGSADVNEFRIEKDEIRIGRGKSCDLVIRDKKASRVHAILRRAGMRLVLVDQGSSHGTFVNDERMTEQEIFSDDVIQIGESRLTLVARDPNYESASQGFAAVPAALQAMSLSTSEAPELAGGNAASDSFDPQAMPQLQGASIGSFSGASDFSGLSGLTQAPPAGEKKTLLQKFRALPPEKQRLFAIGAVLLAFLFTLVPQPDDEEGEKGKAKGKSAQTQKAGAPAGAPGYAQLSEQEKAVVDAARKAALNLWATGELDLTLQEVRKIFQLLPDDPDAKSLQRLTEERKRQREARQEEERAKQKAEDDRLRLEALVAEIATLMKEKKYEEARRRFPEVQERDADNRDIGRWKAEIDEHEKRLIEEQDRKRLLENALSAARSQFEIAEEFRKSGRFKEGIDEYARLDGFGNYEDKKIRAIVRKSRAMIEECRKGIADRRDPLLEQGRTAEEGGDFAAAYAAYDQAKKADPDHPGGQQGMDRVRAALNSRARTAYTEGVLAESFSDFGVAKAKFEEVLRIAPRDDRTPESYYGRAQRKLASYFQLDAGGGAPAAGGVPAAEGGQAQ